MLSALPVLAYSWCWCVSVATHGRREWWLWTDDPTDPTDPTELRDGADG